MIHRVFPQHTFSWAVSISKQLLHTHQEGLLVPFGSGFELGSSGPERRRLRARSWPHRIRVHKWCNCSVERPATKACNCIKITYLTSGVFAQTIIVFHISKLLLKWKGLSRLTGKLVLARLSFASSTHAPFCALNSSCFAWTFPNPLAGMCTVTSYLPCKTARFTLAITSTMLTYNFLLIGSSRGPSSTDRSHVRYNNHRLLHAPRFGGRNGHALLLRAYYYIARDDFSNASSLCASASVQLRL